MYAGQAPAIAGSTAEERRAWVEERYPCIADCDACGICAMIHGKDASIALADYIKGHKENLEVMRQYRRY